MKKRINKILWYGDELLDEKAKAPGAATSADGLDGLNEGEIYISNNEKDPALFIRTSSGKVVRVGSDNLFKLVQDEQGNSYIHTPYPLASDSTVSSLGVGDDEGGIGGTAALYQLVDVLRDGDKVSGAEDGNVLMYDAATGKWYGKKVNLPDVDFSDINDKFVSIDGLIESLQEKDVAHDESITALQTKDAAIEKSITSLQTKDTEHSNAIAALQTKDTAIEQFVASLQGQLNTLVSGDASSAIESFNEVVAFLKDMEDDSTLEGILAGKQNKITETNKLDYSLLANTPSLADFMGSSVIGGTASSENFSAVYWDGTQWKTRTIYKWALASVKPSYTTSEVTEGTRLYFTDDRAKTALKSTTDALSERIAVFEKMFQWGDGDGSHIKTPYSFASDKTVSSLGVGTDGTGGVSYDRLDSWNSYTDDKAGYVLSAALGFDLKTRLDNLDIGDFDLSGYLKVEDAQDIYATIASLTSLSTRVDVAEDNIDALGLKIQGVESNYVKKGGDAMTGQLGFSGSTYPQIYGNGSFLSIGASSDGLYGITLDYANHSMRPRVHDNTYLGSAGQRWRDVYSVLGNFSGQITSSVANGTAPFVVASKTLVSNLNADLLDGKHLSDILASDITGNAATATKLKEPVTLWGQSFDGSSNISGDLTGVGSITAKSKLWLTSTGDEVNIKYNNDNTKSIALNATSFKPYDAANGLLDLGTASARWKGIYGQTLDLTGSITAGSRIYALNANGETLIIAEGKNGKVSLQVDVVRGVYDHTNSKWIIGVNDAGTLLGDGNVGINTPTPTYKLDVNGTLRASGSATIGGTLELSNVLHAKSTIFTHGKTASTDGLSGNVLGQGFISIVGATPYINFYYGNSTSTTSAIKESASGVLSVNNVKHQSGNVLPSADGVGNLGSSSAKWSNAYINTVRATKFIIGSAEIYCDAEGVLRTNASFASDRTVSSLGVGSDEGGTGGAIDLTNVVSHIIPSLSNAYTIGNANTLWKAVYATELYAGNVAVGSAIASLQSNLGTATSNIQGLTSALSSVTSRVGNIETNYLPLSGGILRGTLYLNYSYLNQAHIRFIDNRIGEGGYADNILAIYDSSSNNVGSLGLYGGNTGVLYYYLGHNPYNGDNLRVYADKVTFGNNTVLHAGNIRDYALPYKYTESEPTNSGYGLWGNVGAYLSAYYSSSYNLKFRVISGGALQLKTQANDVGTDWSTIIHSGNIGSQSVSYATSAGDADTLDGQHASRFIGLYTRNDIGTAPNYDNPSVNGLFEIQTTSETPNETGTKPFNYYAPFFSIKAGYVMMQIAGTNNEGWWIRGRQSANVTLEGVQWGRLVTEDALARNWNISVKGNAATATQLKESVTLWGKLFDGSANISGSMTGVGTITSSYRNGETNPAYCLTYDANALYLQSGNGVMHLSGHNVNNLSSLTLHASKSVFTGGKVLIGTDVEDSYNTLRVAGSIGIYAGNTGYTINTNGNIKYIMTSEYTSGWARGISAEIDGTSVGAIGLYGENGEFKNVYINAGGHNSSNGLRVYKGGNVTIGGGESSYKLAVWGTLYASGNATIGGTLNVTDAATFGSTLKVTGAIESNALRRWDGTTANETPFVHGESNNTDITLLRASYATEKLYKTSGAYGFSLKYIGTGGGNANYLKLLADNQTATSQVLAICVDQSGNVGIGTENNSSYKLKVGGTLGVTGATTLSDKLTISQNGMSVTGAAYFGGGTTYYFGSTGNIYANTLNAGATTLRSTLSVSGASTFTGKTTHNGGLGATSGTFSGTLGVTGVATFNNNIKAKKYIYFGANDEAWIYWDATNNVLRTNASFASDKTVSSLGVGSDEGGGGSADWGAVPTNIIPAVNGGYNLGSASSHWSKLYVARIENSDDDLYLNSGGYIRMLTDVVFGNNDNHYISPTGIAYLGNIYSNGNIVATTSWVDSKLNGWYYTKEESDNKYLYKGYDGNTFEINSDFKIAYATNSLLKLENKVNNDVRIAFIGNGTILGYIGMNGSSPVFIDPEGGKHIIALKDDNVNVDLSNYYTKTETNSAISSMLSNYALKTSLGTAASYGVTTSVTSGSTNLVTSGAVYSVLSGYVSKSSASTISAKLTVNELSSNGSISTGGNLSVYGNITIAMGGLTAANGTVSAKTVTQTSDERLKNLIGDVRLSLGSMACAPLKKFHYHDDGLLRVGTLAQYWQGTLPEVVSTTPNGTLALAYGELGVAMGISLANHLTDLKADLSVTDNEVEKLKKRVEELENENKRLQERVDALVA